MPLPLTISCFSKFQIGFTFLVPADRVVLDKGPLNGCLCVCLLSLFHCYPYNCSCVTVFVGVFFWCVLDKLFTYLLNCCVAEKRAWSQADVNCSQGPHSYRVLYWLLSLKIFTLSHLVNQTAGYSSHYLVPVPHTHTHAHTHTHTHTFNCPFSRTTQVSRYQKGKTNLNFTEARDSEWQWYQLGQMQVCTSLQTDNHASTTQLSYFTGRMSFLPPNQQRQSTEGIGACPKPG